MQTSRITIFDTTLRDGEQSPGGSMDLATKIDVALALAGLGVDVIEAGFPAASAGDFAAVAAVARAVDGPIVAGLARCVARDIQQCAKALAPAGRKRLHVFLATSPLHREHKLGLTARQVAERVSTEVARARELCDDVEFSAEDASRTERDFLCEIAARAVEAGATTFNVPDTVGFAVPEQFGDLIRHLITTVPELARATLSVHCHDDLGLAVANSLAAIHAGARQVECTINGIGERAGNCAMEELVMALRTRSDALPFVTGVDPRGLYAASCLVADVTGLSVPRNKAIVGANAFAHASGIHQHGVLCHPGTYEVIAAADVGQTAARLVLGKHSGKHALRRFGEDHGRELSAPALDLALARMKELADAGGSVADDAVIAILDDAQRSMP